MNDISPGNLERALEHQGFREVISRIAQNFNQTLDWGVQFVSEANAVTKEVDPQSKPWKDVRTEHILFMLKEFAELSQRANSMEFVDIKNEMNPLRNLWAMCFSKFAKSKILATNHVTENWTTSAQDDKTFALQKSAIDRSVRIERTYLFNSRKLSERTLSELRYAIMRQLDSRVVVRHITPELVESKANTSALGTKDFIIFDDILVYATIVDSSSDSRERRPTFVRLIEDKELILFASEQWGKIVKYSDELNYENLHKVLDPNGQRG